MKDWDDALLDALRSETDPAADEVVAEYFADLGLGRPRHLIRNLVYHGDLPPEEQAPPVAAYLAERVALPEWADPELISRAGGLFADWGSHIFTILYAASLPTAYAAAKGVQVLHLTARLATDTTRRLNETARFHMDVMTPCGLVVGGRGYRAVRRVRLMHAAVRWLILHDPDVPKTTGESVAGPYWDEAWGLPINQEDLLETLLTFTEIVFEAFDRSGVRYSEADAEAYIHAWSVVGHLLGIRAGLLPLSRADTTFLMAASRRRNHETSTAGQEMTAALLAHAEQALPRLARGLPRSMVRFYVGDPTADLLGVPPAGWSRRLFVPLTVLARVSSYDKAHNRLRRVVSRRVGRAFLQLALEAAPGGARPQYEIPTHLADRWGIRRTVAAG